MPVPLESVGVEGVPEREVGAERKAEKEVFVAGVWLKTASAWAGVRKMSRTRRMVCNECVSFGRTGKQEKQPSSQT